MVITKLFKAHMKILEYLLTKHSYLKNIVLHWYVLLHCSITFSMLSIKRVTPSLIGVNYGYQIDVVMWYNFSKYTYYTYNGLLSIIDIMVNKLYLT
jgi:hypothetical protein